MERGAAEAWWGVLPFQVTLCTTWRPARCPAHLQGHRLFAPLAVLEAALGLHLPGKCSTTGLHPCPRFHLEQPFPNFPSWPEPCSLQPRPLGQLCITGVHATPPLCPPAWNGRLY